MDFLRRKEDLKVAIPRVVLALKREQQLQLQKFHKGFQPISARAALRDTRDGALGTFL